jgi:hypothetical protein
MYADPNDVDDDAQALNLAAASQAALVAAAFVHVKYLQAGSITTRHLTSTSTSSLFEAPRVWDT